MVDTRADTDTETREIVVVLPEKTIRELDAVADADQHSRDEVIAEIAQRFLLDRQWREIQRQLAPRFQAAGLLTEDDIEEYMDSLPE